MVLVLGVDEAGRGPVMGPLVIGAVLMEQEDIPKLQHLGVKDSKLLTPKKRESLFWEIAKTAKAYEIIMIFPNEIDEAIASPNLNLNWLEAIKTAQLINQLNPDEAILDCPSTNTKAYADYLKVYLKNKNIKIIAEHKADVKYAIVSAASIIAKVTRDKEIEKLKEKYGDFGSGYPSDPKVKEFLEKNWNKHEGLFRKSWSTWQRFKNGEKQSNLGGY